MDKAPESTKKALPLDRSPVSGGWNKQGISVKNLHRFMNTIVVGLGNTLISDDGVGPRVAAELKALSGASNISIEEANAGGLGVIDILVGYDRAIIIDAIQTVDGKPGSIYRFGVNALGRSRHSGPVHDFDLATALKLGREAGLVLPREIDIFAIEADDISTFAEECTPEVKKAIPVCAEMIRRELDIGKSKPPEVGSGAPVKPA